jgi:hypothetical protein
MGHIMKKAILVAFFSVILIFSTYGQKKPVEITDKYAGLSPFYKVLKIAFNSQN